MGEILLQLLFLVIGFAMLVKGADWFVDGASGIAEKFRIPQLIIGLTIVAMGTSAPEAAVSITAAFKGSADITIGNIVGSNILNILIILGLSAVIVALPVAKQTIKVDIPFLVGISALLFVLGMDGMVSLWDGVIMLAAFIAYLIYLIYSAKKHPEEVTEEQSKNWPLWKSLIATVVGLGIVIWGSDLAVDASTKLARIFGMSEKLIGLTIVALGTSLPELFTSVTAARKGNADIAIGNIVGSNIFNILFVVGLSSLIIPVPFAASFLIDTIISGAAAILLWLVCLRKYRMPRWSGAVMLACYAGYLTYLIWFI